MDLCCVSFPAQGRRESRGLAMRVCTSSDTLPTTTTITAFSVLPFIAHTVQTFTPDAGKGRAAPRGWLKFFVSRSDGPGD